ncbi:hypothetical protein B0T22DRAFT_45602 [Podospora appendiculata]|uniref:DNA/RNA-binding domain-containing protein n=1 Tax=Podospora appendiculata TaxID=314037 RepID=A0AAE0XHM6_9PEZI|nr:hypothetical protein B0T22DRAFT_45602 [Podospora appendiculata]
MDLEKSWTSWLRKASRPTAGAGASASASAKSPKPLLCSLCRQQIQNGPDFDVFKNHIATAHAGALAQKTTEEETTEWIKSLWEAAQLPAESANNKSSSTSLEINPRTGKVAPAIIEGGQPPPSSQPSNRRKAAEPEPPPDPATRATQPRQDLSSGKRSPEAVSDESLKREGSRSQSPPKRSKATRPTSTSNPAKDEFSRGPAPKGRLWSADDDSAKPRPQSYDKSNVATNHRLRVSSGKPQRQGHQPQPSAHRTSSQPQVEEDAIELIKQPETRPISQEQLVAEVKGIYAGLVMVESKCIEVDNAQNAQNDPNNKLNNEQWQALIALHRTLLHEHHDFFLASQHPSASPALRRLASKYAMPARMWRHGIHSFLELLRHRLPASLEHMLTFIYLAYSMMALLYETVPAFEDTWIECLGDLGRYRMAIEDDDIRDREVWTAVSRHWYSKASDKAPTTGRLYHHLAILARPTALQQLFYYTKSLCVAIPFGSARESIMTLFEPIMGPNSNQQSRLAPTELAFVRTHGIMFSKKSTEKLESSMDEFLGSLDNHIGRSTRRWLEPGYYIGISNCCAIVGYGNENNPVFNAIRQIRVDEPQDQLMAGSEIDESTPKDLSNALRLANRTHNVVLRRFGDPNILPYLHVTLAFIYHLSSSPEAMAYLAPDFPWKLTAVMLNTFLGSFHSHSRIESQRFPQSENAEVRRPLPEDYAMRGLLWVDKYFPADWFSNDKIDDDEKYFEVASMSEERKERVLYLGCRIAARDGKWLRYDSDSHQFSVSPQYDIELDTIALAPSDSTEYGELPDATAGA